MRLVLRADSQRWIVNRFLKHPDVAKGIDIALRSGLGLIFDWTTCGGAMINLETKEIKISMRDSKGRFTNVERFLNHLFHELGHWQCKLDRKFARYHNRSLTYDVAKQIGLRAERYVDKVGEQLMERAYEGKYKYERGYALEGAAELYRQNIEAEFAGTAQKGFFQDYEDKDLRCSVKYCKMQLECWVMVPELGKIGLCDKHWDKYCEDKSKILEKIDKRRVEK